MVPCLSWTYMYKLKKIKVQYKFTTPIKLCPAISAQSVLYTLAMIFDLYFPDTKITDICSTAEYEATSTYIASPNFPENYPPNKDCRCVVSSTDPDAKVILANLLPEVKYPSLYP